MPRTNCGPAQKLSQSDCGCPSPSSFDKPDDISMKSDAYLAGGGIGSLATAAFMIRDGGPPGGNISILEAAPAMGGSRDGGGDPAAGCFVRGGRMLTTRSGPQAQKIHSGLREISQAVPLDLQRSMTPHSRFRNYWDGLPVTLPR